MRSGERAGGHEYVVDWELDEAPEGHEEQVRTRRGLHDVEVRWEALRPEPPRRSSEPGGREERG